MKYLLICISSFATAICTVLSKFYTDDTKGIKNSYAIFLLFSHPIAIIFFFILAKGDIPINFTTLLYVIIYAIICLTSVLFTLISYNKTNLINVAVFTGAGRVILPFLVELIFSISYFSVYEILSAVFRLIAVCCPFLFAKAKGKGLLYCIILFIISGAAVLLVKFYNMSADVVSDNSFCFWSNVVILPATVIMLLCRNKPKAIISDIKRIKVRAYLLLIGFTLLNNFCTLLSIYAMNFMSATIFSVLQTSGVFILTSVFSVLMFKERFTKSEFFSLIFSVISVIFGIF